MSEPRYRYLKAEVQQGVLVLTLSPPRLEGDAIAQLILEDVQAAVAHYTADKVVLNLEHVDYLTSANFRPFLNLRKQLLAAGGRLVLCNLTPTVREIFEVTRLIGTGNSLALFQVQPDVPTAVASLLAEPQASSAPSA